MDSYRKHWDQNLSCFICTQRNCLQRKYENVLYREACARDPPHTVFRVRRVFCCCTDVCILQITCMNNAAVTENSKVYTMFSIIGHMWTKFQEAVEMGSCLGSCAFQWRQLAVESRCFHHVIPQDTYWTSLYMPAVSGTQIGSEITRENVIPCSVKFCVQQKIYQYSLVCVHCQVLL
jgi:hypothetical protein